MIRQGVTSTSVESIGYDESTHTLEIEFRDGGIYQYLAVPRAVYLELLGAPSIGAYVNRDLRGRFDYRQIS